PPRQPTKLPLTQHPHQPTRHPNTKLLLTLHPPTKHQRTPHLPTKPPNTRPPRTLPRPIKHQYTPRQLILNINSL
ncbi:putative Cuticular protein, partial [Daphnia magna]